MKHKVRHQRGRLLLLAMVMVIVTAVSARLRADTGTCGGASVSLPFTDVSSSNIFFCSIAEAYFSALTNGTTPTTYSPSDPVPREQMAAFITRTLDRALQRGSRRAALNQWWTPQTFGPEAATAAGHSASDVVSDGMDLWTIGMTTVNRVRASDGAVIAGFQRAPGTTGVVASGRIYIAGGGTLWKIGATGTSTISSSFSPNLTCITFDGTYVWTGTDSGVIGKTSRLDDSVATISTSFGSLQGMLFDGANVWITETGDPVGHIRRLNASGDITLSVTTGVDPRRPVFDGTNIWVPNHSSNWVNVIRASNGTVVATLTGNGLNGPTAAAFDGQRIAVINTDGNSVSLWNATDLSPLGSVAIVLGSVPASPTGVCSDGVNFWIVTGDPISSVLLRF